ncbi:MAG: type II toxin-antitoxin system YafQ family toxin [bacterium]|nr:type II toxin-antitoxin system YafQ family toxin [bacterium]
MYTLQVTPQFKRDVKRCKQEGRNLKNLWEVVAILLHDGCVPESYKPHELGREFAGRMECHIEDDWLLVWKQNDNKMTMLFTNTGTHDYLFNKK